MNGGERSEKEPLLSSNNQRNVTGLTGRDTNWWKSEEGVGLKESGTLHRRYFRVFIISISLLLLLMGFILIVMGLLLVSYETETKNWVHHNVSTSMMTSSKYSTIVTDAAPCATIGNYILLTNHGNIIDAAIASLICTGVYNLHSMGISGGSFLVYYEKSSGKVYTLDSREAAPLAARENMYVGKDAKASQYGGLSIAVPGEVAGYYEAWKRWGKVPWEDLFKPTIKLLRKGYHIYPSFGENIVNNLETIKKYSNPTLRDHLYNAQEKRWYKEGDFRTFEKLANTLEIISREPLAMYNGSLVDKVVKEIQDAGGIITVEDLKQYQPQWRESISIPLLGTNYTLHAMEPPSSGAVVAFILNIMSGYGYSSRNISSLHDVANYFHRFVEASKFGFAKRSALGDMNFANDNITETFQYLLDANNSNKARERINDHRTFDISYYGPSFVIPKEKGTSHFSGIDKGGNALSMTSTINGEFGSMVMGEETGILYNNEMDDFSSPNKSNDYDLPPSPSNFIQPGKRPMSSMSPIIITDDSTGKVKFVAGGSGGSRIISSVSQVAGHHLFLGKTVKEANDMWRFHHQLYPDEIRAAHDIPQAIHKELQSRGHKFGKTMPLTAIQILSLGDDGRIYGNADYRKNGLSIGL
jgi:gamma-glutamyltranspeptidase / glutathione hydrolase / leukotriene-C4 hydrolase